MQALHVPFALDADAQLCLPTSAAKGGSYFCPGCGAAVILKQGPVKTPHFAHKATEVCHQETITHKTAKLLIQTAVHAWKAGQRSAPTLERKCFACGVPLNQTLPEKVDSAALEYRLTDGSIADVVLLAAGQPQAAVEIKVTHAVDAVKAQRLPLPFIELDGYAVVKNPSVWKPITDKFKLIACEACKAAYARLHTKAQQLAQASQLALPTAYYRYALGTCRNCQHPILIFDWPAPDKHTAPKHHPPPKTVQYRFLPSAGRKCWVNTCPHCQAIQDTAFLAHEAEDAGVADTPSAFTRDMLKIAAHAALTGRL